MEKIKGLFAKINNLYAGHKFLLVITYISILFAISYDIWLFHFMLSTYRRLCDIILLLPYGFLPVIFLILYFIFKKFVPRCSKFLYILMHLLIFLCFSFVFYIISKPLAFIPAICLIIYFVLHKFLPRVTKYVNMITNILLFLIFSFIFYNVLELSFEYYVFDYLPYNSQKYQNVLSHLSDKDKDNIKLFFPKEIPNDAKNVEFKELFYVLIDDYDYGIVQLKFKTSPKYIKEIKSKDYNAKDISDYIKSDLEYLKKYHKGLKSHDIVYQVIDKDVCIYNDRDGHLIGYIAVDNKHNEVLYVYLLYKNKKKSNICKGKKMYYMK